MVSEVKESSDFLDNFRPILRSLSEQFVQFSTDYAFILKIRPIFKDITVEQF